MIGGWLTDITDFSFSAHCPRNEELGSCAGQLSIMINNLKRGKIYFVSWFELMVVWLHYFLAHGKAEHHGGEHVVEQCCLPNGFQEAKR
jgi:hypothetical protein